MSHYEFSPTENTTISKAALWAKVLGFVLIGEGVLTLINTNVISAIADIGMGIVTIQGASALEKVVNSQGQDVPLMVEALNKISTLFLVRLIFAAIAAFFLACALIAGLFIGAAALSM